MRDIVATTAIKQFVNRCYSKVKNDKLLCPVFALRIADHA